MMTKIKAWYFAANDNKLRYGDNREIVLGDTHEVKGEPVLCANGLHASERVIDALLHAPVSILYQVELSGKLDIGKDKLCATKRTYIQRIDATELLQEFARSQALINIEKIKPYTSESEYDVIVEYLETGDKQLLTAARSAARSAAESAAESAARSAARSAETAVWSATEAAAWTAARSAARSAESAAWTAAKSAARFAVCSAAESARSAAESARSAAESAETAVWSATEAAAWTAANTVLENMVLKELEKSK